MSKAKWIKIVTDIFDDEKILLIESMPDADGIIVIWFKLLCLAGKQNNSGVFTMPNGIPYNEKMLASIFRRKESAVSVALQTFEQFGMIEIVNSTVTIPNWGKHQSLDSLESSKEKNRLRQQKYREKQKLLANNNILGDNNSESAVCSNALDKSDGRNVTVTLHSGVSNAGVTPLERDIDIERDIDRLGSGSTRASPDSGLAVVMAHYMDFIGSLPSSEVNARLQGYLDHMTPEVIINAINIGADSGQRTWPYINAILNRRKNSGVRNMADVAREEEEWERKKARKQSEKSSNPFLEMLKEEENGQDGSFENNGSAENGIPGLSEGHE